jgi:hypothetical protein
MSADALVAFFLLTAPPAACPEPAPEGDRWPAVQKAVQELAKEWEILDEREMKYILAKPDEFGSDLNLLRRRYQELKDVPLVADAARLPDRSVANDLVKFNRAYRKTLETRQHLETDRAAELQSAVRETDRLYAVWDAVRDARCEYYYVTVRRQSLKKLRELVGNEAYQAGELPPVVPTWRFADAR